MQEARKPSPLARLALVLGGLLVGLLIAGAVLRLMARFDGPLSSLERVQLSGWKLCREPAECNELGYRGRSLAPEEGALRVVLLGDSQVSAWAQPPEEMPERVLEAELEALLACPVQVVTVGCDGYGQGQQLLALQEYFVAHEAELVLLWYTEGNDLANTLFATTLSGTPKPTWWLEDGVLKGPTEPWLSPVGGPPGWRGLLDRYSPLERRREWEARLPPAHEPLREHDGPLLTDWQERWDSGDRWRLQELRREMSPFALALTPRSERTAYGIELSRALLEEIRRLCAENGARFESFQELRPPHDPDPRVQAHVLDGEIWLTSERQRRENVADIFRDQTLHQVRLDLEDHAVSETDRHLNSRAIRLVLRELAERLAASGLGGPGG